MLSSKSPVPTGAFLQLLQPETHTLVITAQRGFHKPFLEQRNRDGD